MAMDPIDVAKIIEAQSRQAIVFRQHFPPSFTRSLSYFGGAPTAGAEFVWPRWQDPQGNSRPLSFIMQVDCSAIPTAARLGVLPDDGVLYFFMELTGSYLGTAYRVIHHAGPTGGWREVSLPEDLPPATSFFYLQYAIKESHLPRMLPHWDFTPTVINIPPESYEYQEREDDEPYLWPGISAEILRAAQGGPIINNQFSFKDFGFENGVFRRPFETFPHDWRAVLYLMGMLIEKLECLKKYPTGAPFGKTLSDEEVRMQILPILEEAHQFYDLAAAHPADEAVPEMQRDAVWAFLNGNAGSSRFISPELFTLSVEDSLARSPQAASLIPPDVAERIRGRHALVASYEGNEEVKPPERMLAPPTSLQDGQWWADTQLLLLELSTNLGLGRDFGSGICQLYIAPDDLKARRFDKVKKSFPA